MDYKKLIVELLEKVDNEAMLKRIFCYIHRLICK